MQVDEMRKLSDPDWLTCRPRTRDKGGSEEDWEKLLIS